MTSQETGCGLSGYLDLYRTHAPQLLQQRGEFAAGHPDPVASTLVLSFEKIEQANPAAAELLRFCAFMHPDRIPEEVLSEGAPELGPTLGPVGSDAFALNGAISACAELINQWGFKFPETPRLLNRAGVYLSERGHYADAAPFYERALSIREKTLSPEHPDL